MSEPDYYAKNGLSPLQAFEQGLLSRDELIGFCKGNVIKYTIRAGEKTDDPLIDIVKAMDYLHYLHKALKTEPVTNNSDDGGEYTVADLDSKLNEVKKSLDDFKKEHSVTEDNENTVSVRSDERLRHVEPLVHTPKPRKRRWLNKLMPSELGAWY